MGTTALPERLRAAGLRVTLQRVAVLEALQTRPHASAETIFSLLREHHSVALPTVRPPSRRAFFAEARRNARSWSSTFSMPRKT